MNQKTFSYTFSVGDVYTDNNEYLKIVGFMGQNYIELRYCTKNGEPHPFKNGSISYPAAKSDRSHVVL